MSDVELTDAEREIAEDLWRVEKERAQAIGYDLYEDRYEDEPSYYRDVCEAQARRVAARLSQEREQVRAEVDDLRSRLGCVMEATWWDRPYDTRIEAIRGMCDLATDGMTPTSDGQQTKADAIEQARAERDEWWRTRLATCVCECDVTLHYDVCSTEGCMCTFDRNRAVTSASDLALLENDDDLAQDGPRPAQEGERACGKSRRYFSQQTCALPQGHAGAHEDDTHVWEDPR